MITTIFTFVILLSVLILVHELGHFLAAKHAGVRVEEFGLGLPPRLWGKKIGETIYSINWLPIGGFVKLAGEDIDDEEDKSSEKSAPPVSELSKSFANQTHLTQAGIISAGVVMNFLLGVFLTGVFFAFLGVPVIQNLIEIKEVASGSPAQQAGVVAEDLIVKYDSSQVTNSEDFVNFVNAHLGEKIEFTVRQQIDSKVEEKVVQITPRANPPEGQGPLGIVFVVVPEISYQKIPIYRVPDSAFTESLKLTGLLFTGVVGVFKDWIVTRQAPQDIAGPVGIARITSEVVKQGIFQVLNFAALLSINLAVINILPFPGLDGGRLAFVAVEAVLRRKISPHYQKWVHTIGIAVLLLLMLIITFYDIVRWL